MGPTTAYPFKVVITRYLLLEPSVRLLDRMPTFTGYEPKIEGDPNALVPADDDDLSEDLANVTLQSTDDFLAENNQALAASSSDQLRET